MSGRLVVVCGIDGSGKSSLVSGLAARCESVGEKTVQVKMPSFEMREHSLFRSLYSSDPSERQRVDVLSLCLMVMADRLQMLKETVVPLLDEGITVVSDRYVYTGIVEAAVRGVEDLSSLFAICQLFLRPDLALLASVSTELAIARIRNRPHERNLWLDTELMKFVNDSFHSLAAAQPEFRVLDTSGELDKAVESAYEVLAGVSTGKTSRDTLSV
jgi:dTMP kinase